MTTIAANLECMAADTRVTCDSQPMYSATKIFRIKDSLFGTAGDAYMTLALLRWLEGPRDIYQLHTLFEHADKDEITVLELSPVGLFLWNGWGVPERLLNTSYAIGSGGMPAASALLRGESPEDAIRSSVELDPYTGGRVQVEWLDLPTELQTHPQTHPRPRRK